MSEVILATSDTQDQMDDIQVSVNLMQSAVEADHNDLYNTKAKLVHLEAGNNFIVDLRLSKLWIFLPN